MGNKIPTFGSSLTEQWAVFPQVPQFVVASCEAIQARGDTAGLFTTPASRGVRGRESQGRVPSAEKGHLRRNPAFKARVKEIESIRRQYDQGKGYQVDLNGIGDVHVVAGLLKVYFRELEPPLCTHELYDTFVNSATQRNQLAGQVALRGAIASLSVANRSVLAYMVAFLRSLLRPPHSETNGLTASSVATAFAPLWLRKNKQGRLALGEAGEKPAEAIAVGRAMLEDYDELFKRSNEEEVVARLRDATSAAEQEKDHRASLQAMRREAERLQVLQLLTGDRHSARNTKRRFFGAWRQLASESSSFELRNGPARLRRAEALLKDEHARRIAAEEEVLRLRGRLDALEFQFNLDRMTAESAAANAAAGAVEEVKEAARGLAASSPAAAAAAALAKADGLRWNSASFREDIKEIAALRKLDAESYYV